MPTPLPTISLASASVGQTGTIDLTPAAPTGNPAFTQRNATLLIYNESGVGLRLSGQVTGLAFDLPAGGWVPQPVPPAETTINYTVLYVLQNQPVSQLIATYYQPGEPVSLANLGNSPIGLSTNVPLNATATAVANDGNAANTEFIEASIGGVKNVSLQNQGYLELFGATAGGNQPKYALKDYTTGRLYQLFLMTDGSIMWQEAVNGAFGLRLFPDGHFTVDAGNIASDGAGNLTTKQITPAKINSDATKFVTDGAGLLTLRGVQLINGGGGVYTGQTGQGWQAVGKFTGTVTGTYSHNAGVAPTHCTPMQSAVGSQTMGWDSPTATQVHITSGAGNAFSCMAWNI